MDDLKVMLVGALAVVNGFITGYFGTLSPLLYVVAFLMLMDLATRCYAAGIRKDENIESKKVIEGLYNKLGMVFLIVLALIIDFGLVQISAGLGINIASKIIFTALTLAWIFVRELISNLENLHHAGIKLPTFIIKALTVAKDKIDSVGDSIINSK